MNLAVLRSLFMDSYEPAFTSVLNSSLYLAILVVNFMALIGYMFDAWINKPHLAETQSLDQTDF